MQDYYFLSTAYGVLLGALGGACCHAVWLFNAAKAAAQSGKVLSKAKTRVQQRLQIFILALVLGAIAGFLVSLFARSWYLAAYGLIAFGAGFGFEAFFGKIGSKARALV